MNNILIMKDIFVVIPGKPMNLEAKQINYHHNYDADTNFYPHKVHLSWYDPENIRHTGNSNDIDIQYQIESCSYNRFTYEKSSCRLHGSVLRQTRAQQLQRQQNPDKSTLTPLSSASSPPPPPPPPPPPTISQTFIQQSSVLNQRKPYLFHIPFNRYGDVIYVVTPVALNGSLGVSAEYATRFDDSKGMAIIILDQ